jgi:ABC-type nitrate/sulfonate/bicarbonate transport system permease component
MTWADRIMLAFGLAALLGVPLGLLAIALTANEVLGL